MNPDYHEDVYLIPFEEILKLLKIDNAHHGVTMKEADYHKLEISVRRVNVERD